MGYVQATRHSGRRGALAIAAVAVLLGATHGALANNGPAAAQTADPVAYDSGQILFSTDDVLGGVLGSTNGTSEGRDGDVILGNDPGEDTSGNIVTNDGITLSPIDSSFTTDELDFFGATPRDRDGVYEEGYAGNVSATADRLPGLALSDVATDIFKAGAPLGTWAAGLGGEAIKASTEHFTVMEAILTCNQTYPYQFWTSEEEYDADLLDDGILNSSVPELTQAALAEEGLSCAVLTDPNAVTDLDGNPLDLDDLIPNEDSVIMDMGVDPENSYSVTKKDDGKLLFRWGTSVKKPTDVRFQKSIPLPEAWKDAALDGQKGYRVTRAELVVRHNITNNPNDQIRPEDWENEAANGRLPDHSEVTIDGENYWVSTTNCYEGNGNFIPAGTLFKYPEGANPTVDASDLQHGFTPAWYTTIQRDPFEWSYRNLTTGELVGSRVSLDDPNLELVSGPRWRLTANKFGQDLPGLEIPSTECAQPPYQQGEKRYETGDPITTTINLLDWDPDEPRWDDAASPMAYSAGWMANWNEVEVPGQIVLAEDALRCVATQATGECITELSTTLTEDFDVSFYIKGDIKAAVVNDVQLIIEYDPTPVAAPVLDFGDAPDTYGTLLASGGASHTVGDLTMGALIDDEADGQPTAGADGDDLAGDDDEDGVAFGTLQAGTPGTVTVTAAGGLVDDAELNGWIDFDANGVFDADEQVVDDAPVVAGPNVVEFTVPADAAAGSTFARFRISDFDGTIGPTVGDGIGEVEDHVVEITSDTDPPVPEVTDPFLSITPTRVLDTRDGLGYRLGEWNGTSPLIGGTTVEIPVRSFAGLPADAKVAAVNLTVTDAVGPGFLTVYPCGTTRPTASNMNFQPGDSRAGLAFAPISSTGAMCVYSHQTTELIVDVIGYTPVAGTYQALSPVRVVDTRETAPVAANTTLRITPPASSADDLAISVTSVNAASNGFLTAYSCAAGRPETSTVNYQPGETSANLTMVDNGDICVFSNQLSDVVVDLHGEFTAPVDLTKVRLLDTRTTSTPTAGSTITFDPSTSPELAGAELAAVNVTSTGSTADGFLTVWNCESARPTTSNLNFQTGESIANLALVDVSSPVCVYFHKTSDLILDLTAIM